MTARQHHYVPQCYLKGFVEDREKPKLFTVDFRARHSFSTHPKNVAAERDFHRIEIEGHPPDALENSFSGFETELDQALRRIVTARSIEHPDDRAYLFNLIGLTAAKNPRLRKSFGDFHEQILKMVMDVATATPERWAAQVKQAQKDGFLPEQIDVDYQTMRKFIEHDEFNIITPTDTHLAMEMNALDGVLPHIFERKWLLFRAPVTGGFITSDHPMCLMWSDPAQRGRGPYPPGLALLGTQLLFPISTELAIIGAFELEKDDIIEADEKQIAEINGSIILHARHQIYARDADFSYLFKTHNEIRRGAQLLQDLMPSTENVEDQ